MKKFLFKKLLPSRNTRRGFSLFEVLVSVAIFSLLTSSLIIENGKFRNQTLTANLAYEIGLVFRKAQSFGIGVRGSDPAFSVTQATKYFGIFFSRADDRVLTLYRDGDSNDNGIYDGVTTDIRVDTFALDPKYKILRFCAKEGNVEYCSDSPSVTELNVSFKRPDPSAKIIYKRGEAPKDASEARIEVTQRQGTGNKISSVTIYSTGQIYVRE